MTVMTPINRNINSSKLFFDQLLKNTRNCILFLVSSILVTTAERSFSKLKWIKNFPISSTGQDHLTIFNVERLTFEINLDKIINYFSNMKASKMNFRF